MIKTVSMEVVSETHSKIVVHTAGLQSLADFFADAFHGGFNEGQVQGFGILIQEWIQKLNEIIQEIEID